MTNIKLNSNKKKILHGSGIYSGLGKLRSRFFGDSKIKSTKPNSTIKLTKPNSTIKSTEYNRTIKLTKPNSTIKSTENNSTIKLTKPNGTIKSTENNSTIKSTENNSTIKLTKPNSTIKSTTNKENNYTNSETNNENNSSNTVNSGKQIITKTNFNEKKAKQEIKNKLLSKGYKNKEINNLLNKKYTNISIAEAKISGITLLQLKQAGFTLSELKDIYTISELKNAGFSALELKKNGFSIEKLKKVGFTATQLKNVGFTASNLSNADFTLKQIINSGYNQKDVKNFNSSELKKYFDSYQEELLLININENYKSFNSDSLFEISENIERKKPSIIIVCAINSVSKSTTHFITTLKKNLELNYKETYHVQTGNMRFRIFIKNEITSEKKLNNLSNLSRYIVNSNNKSKLAFFRKMITKTKKSYVSAYSLNITMNRKKHEFIFINISNEIDLNKLITSFDLMDKWINGNTSIFIYGNHILNVNDIIEKSKKMINNIENIINNLTKNIINVNKIHGISEIALIRRKKDIEESIEDYKKKIKLLEKKIELCENIMSLNQNNIVDSPSYFILSNNIEKSIKKPNKDNKLYENNPSLYENNLKLFANHLKLDINHLKLKSDKYNTTLISLSSCLPKKNNP